MFLVFLKKFPLVNGASVLLEFLLVLCIFPFEFEHLLIF